MPETRLLARPRVTLLAAIPRAATEVPPIEVFHRETPSPFTIGGFKGMGEGGAIAPGPCLANAVSDALAPWTRRSTSCP